MDRVDDPVDWSAPVLVVGAGASRLACVLNASDALAISEEAQVVRFFATMRRLAALPSGKHETWNGNALFGMLPAPNLELFGTIHAGHEPAIVCEYYRRLFPRKPFRRWGDTLRGIDGLGDIAQDYPSAQFIHAMETENDDLGIDVPADRVLDISLGVAAREPEAALRRLSAFLGVSLVGECGERLRNVEVA